MNKKKLFGEEDKVLRYAVTAVIILFIMGIFVISMRMTNLRVDSSAGEKKLKELEKMDVQQIDAQIRELEKQEKIEDEYWQNRPNNEKFTDCLILGDSISQGLYVYEFLDASLVIAEKGVGVHEPDESGLSYLLLQVLDAKPQKLFLALGMNDIIGLDGDAREFAEEYGELLDKLAQETPDTEVYVNSVLPASPQAVSADGRYAGVPEYNAELQALCGEKEVTFIDNTELVSEEFYDADGVHMKGAYYQLWIDHMVEVAGL